MKLKSLLLLPALVLSGAGVHAQLAAKISSSNSYGKIFTDGSAIYEVHGDTLGTIDGSTGARSFIAKLPAPPSGNYIVRWASPYAVKTPGGFIITQDLQDQNAGFARTVRIWSNIGGSWDTLATSAGTFNPTEPYKMGSKYAIYMPGANSTGQLLRTDGTKAGTSVVFSLASFYTLNPINIRSGSSRIFFNATVGSSIPSTFPAKLYAMDDNSLAVIDSSSSTCLPLAAFGDTLVYDYKHQSGQPGTPNLVTTHSLKKWTPAGGAAGLATGLSTLSSYFDGAAYQGKAVAQVLDSGSQAPNLVTINLGSGAVTYLTANPKNSTYPNYFLSRAGFGTAHIYLPQLEAAGWSTLATDAATVSGTKKVFTSRSGPAFQVPLPGAFGPASAIVCGDELYGQHYTTSGSFNAQLFRVSANGSLDSQMLNTGVVGGSTPDNFIKAGGTIYFTALSNSGTSGPRDFWKITACTSGTNTVAKMETPSVALLYPNPAGNTITVTMRPVPNAELEITDAAGRSVLRTAVQNGGKVGVESLAPGLYLWRIGSGPATLGTGRLAVIR